MRWALVNCATSATPIAEMPNEALVLSAIGGLVAGFVVELLAAKIKLLLLANKAFACAIVGAPIMAVLGAKSATLPKRLLASARATTASLKVEPVKLSLPSSVLAFARLMFVSLSALLDKSIAPTRPVACVRLIAPVTLAVVAKPLTSDLSATASVADIEPDTSALEILTTPAKSLACAKVIELSEILVALLKMLVVLLSDAFSKTKASASAAVTVLSVILILVLSSPDLPAAMSALAFDKLMVVSDKLAVELKATPLMPLSAL